MGLSIHALLVRLLPKLKTPRFCKSIANDKSEPRQPKVSPTKMGQSEINMQAYPRADTN